MTTHPVPVPLPRNLAWREGRFRIGPERWRFAAGALDDEAVSLKMCSLGIQAVVDAALPPFSVAAGSGTRDIPAIPAHREGYALAVDPDGLLLAAADADGLFWGLTTIAQLRADGDTLPACRIADWPAIALRGHFDDISRGQVSRLEDFQRIIRRLSFFKINAYSLYLEDLLHLGAYPDAGEGRGKLLPGEVREIVAEAARHKVTIIPAFQVLGHQERLLATGNYRRLGREVFQAPSTLDPDKPEVREFLTRCLAEVCALFPGPYICIGLDETQGIGKDAYIRHANWCAREVARYGKTPVFWADMLYNHFGLDTLSALDGALIPANWNYDVIHAPIPHQDELASQGRPVWGFAGYNNWTAFLPDFMRAKDHIGTWADAQGGRDDGQALFCCQWGDEGYENSRELCWELFAYFAECAWSGPERDRQSFTGRFQDAFYGARLPGVEALGGLAGRLSFPPSWYWRFHRKNAFALQRHAAAHPEWRAALHRDMEMLMEAGAALAADRSRALREETHLDHFQVSLDRLALAVRRMLLAYRQLEGISPMERAREAEDLAGEIRRVREEYAGVWLRHNKREGLAASLAVFDELAACYERMIGDPAPPLDRERFLAVDLSQRWNSRHEEIAGIPIGPAVYHGIPFHFADCGHTHLALSPSCDTLTQEFAPAAFAEIHLVAAAPKPQDEKPLPALGVELLREGKCIYETALSLITHLVDWWAPLGEHIWAGGGYRHADQARVHYLCKPDVNYGLMRISGFHPDGMTADAIRLSLLAPVEVQIFAATLEIGKRCGDNGPAG